MTVYINDPDLTIHVGDVRDVLAGLPDGSVDCVVTSPPAILIELNPEYARMAARRLSQLSLLAEGAA